MELVKELFDDARARFDGIGQDKLREYAKVLGINAGNCSEDTLRRKLLEKLGEGLVTTNEVEVKHEGVGISDVDDLFKLDLSGKGKWKGRRRRIVISRPDGYEGRHPQVVKWGQQTYWIRYDAEVSAPYPVWNILKNAKPKRIVQRRAMTEEGVYTIRNQFIPYDRFRISDMGDDPETAHLPVSQKHQFRALSEMTEGFRTYKGKPFSRQQLMMVATRLKLKPHQMRDWEDDDIRASILEYTGELQGLEAA